MESQPQNPEFRNNPENFHPCFYTLKKDSEFDLDYMARSHFMKLHLVEKSLAGTPFFFIFKGLVGTSLLQCEVVLIN